MFSIVLRLLPACAPPTAEALHGHWVGIAEDGEGEDEIQATLRWYGLAQMNNVPGTAPGFCLLGSVEHDGWSYQGSREYSSDAARERGYALDLPHVLDNRLLRLAEVEVDGDVLEGTFTVLGCDGEECTSLLRAGSFAMERSRGTPSQPNGVLCGI